LYIIHLFFNPFLTSVIYTLSLHDALPISPIYLTNRSLGAWNTNTNNIVHYFGLWSWEGDYTSGAAQVYTNHFDPLWIPDLTRDFHPFFLTPPMPYELSRIPFWTDKTLPVYGQANIYPNYQRYQYGQCTGD